MPRERRRVLFLPGASGAGAFWRPVADCLPAEWEKRIFDWPGLGAIPRDPRVNAFDDLSALVLRQLDTPADLVAQSMGGLVAMLSVLARPDAVRRLVLVATSGGIDLSPFGVEEWRAEYREEFPDAAPFVTDATPRDLSAELARVTVPTLLLWAEGDAISPPAVGRQLQSHLRNAPTELVILPYTDHMFARDHADQVAPLIARHLSADV